MVSLPLTQLSTDDLRIKIISAAGYWTTVDKTKPNTIGNKLFNGPDFKQNVKRFNRDKQPAKFQITEINEKKYFTYDNQRNSLLDLDRRIKKNAGLNIFVKDSSFFRVHFFQMFFYRNTYIPDYVVFGLRILSMKFLLYKILV